MTSKELIAQIEKRVASTDEFESELMTRKSPDFADDCATYFAVQRGAANVAFVAYNCFKSSAEFNAWLVKVKALPKLTAAYNKRHPSLRREAA